MDKSRIMDESTEGIIFHDCICGYRCISAEMLEYHQSLSEIKTIKYNARHSSKQLKTMEK